MSARADASRLSLSAGAAIGCVAAGAALASPMAALMLCGAVLLALAFVWMLGAPLRWWTVFVAAALLLPPLPFALGSAGPHVAVALALLGLCMGIAGLRHWRFTAEATGLALASLTFWLFASVLVAALYSGGGAALASGLRVGLFGIGVFVYFFVAHGPGILASIEVFAWARTAFALASASAAFAIADFYFQWPPPGGFAEQFVWLPFGVLRRAQGVFYEAGMLGNLCAMFLLMAAVAVLRADVRRRIAGPAALLAGSTLLLIALAATFSRSSALNLATALAALLALEHRRLRSWQPAAALLFVPPAAAGIAWLASPQVFSAYLGRLLDLALYSGVMPGALLSGRFETWSLVLSKLAEKPVVLLTGIGFKTLPEGGRLGPPLVADNMYLSLLAETGIPGLFLLAALSAAILSAGLRARRRGSPAAWFCGTWIVCYWAGNLAQMASVDVLTYWRVLPLAFFVLALARREERAVRP